MSRRPLIPTLLALPLAGCFLGGLSEEEACDLSADWLASHTVVLLDGEEVHGADVTGCGQMNSRQDVGEAEIRVHIEWQGEEDGISYTYDDSVDCYLLEYDQGWDVEACIDS